MKVSSEHHHWRIKSNFYICNACLNKIITIQVSDFLLAVQLTHPIKLKSSTAGLKTCVYTDVAFFEEHHLICFVSLYTESCMQSKTKIRFVLARPVVT